MERSIPERRPIFKLPVEPEFAELQQKVEALVHDLEGRKDRIIKLKILLFPILYFGTYALLLLKGHNPLVFYLCYMFLGLFLLLNFLNLIHDAVHGVTFKKHRNWNKIFLYFFDLLGANSYIWKIRHLRLHHAFPNIMGWDSDLEQSPLVRIFPQSSRKKIQKYQHIYLPFLYPLYLFNWLLIRDFKDFFNKDQIVHRVTKIPTVEYVKLFFFKIVFFGYIIAVPKFVLGVSWWAVLSGFILLMFTASVTSLLVLLSPHASVESEFPQKDEKGKMPHTWFMHQLLCTNDVSNDNFFVRFFMASFNYHIAHHVFPYIHHSYYPEVTRILEDFAHRHNFPYRKHSLKTSLLNHYALLKRNAWHENIFEETM
jgi:linoleoyl-CoA desaturase